MGGFTEDKKHSIMSYCEGKYWLSYGECGGTHLCFDFSSNSSGVGKVKHFQLQKTVVCFSEWCVHILKVQVIVSCIVKHAKRKQMMLLM